MANGAVIEEPYRYYLWRDFEPNAKKRVCFIMLNPSTADAADDDPTIRRCIGFAKAWGYGAIDVVNLFALRSTDPMELYRRGRDTVIGMKNDTYLVSVAMSATLVVCAWGSHAIARERGYDICKVLREKNVALTCLRRTAVGAPCHPLYLPKKLVPELYEPPIPRSM